MAYVARNLCFALFIFFASFAYFAHICRVNFCSIKMCLFFFKKLKTSLQDKSICNISELLGVGMVTRGCFTLLRGTKKGGNQMNKSSLDSEHLKGGILKKEEGRGFCPNSSSLTLYFFPREL